jgi:hypothetical protein
VNQLSGTIEMAELVGMLGQSLGDEKAKTVLANHARRQGVGRGPYRVEDALSILESITDEPGIVGTTARFAKSRLHLRSA